jgi:hypothetical protein
MSRLAELLIELSNALLIFQRKRTGPVSIRLQRGGRDHQPAPARQLFSARPLQRQAESRVLSSRCTAGRELRSHLAE